MKKIFTFVCALMGFAAAVNAATVDDIAVCKHSYVLCFDDWDGNGTAKPGKGQLFGNGYFLDVTGGSVATNKGKVNLSVLNDADDLHVTQYIVDTYGADYPDDHYNSWRLKNAQDVIAMKVTAGSKLIFFLHGNAKSGTAARIPKIATDAALNNALNAAPDADFPTTDTGFRYEWIAPDDGLIYIGSYNGDTFFSFLIVEANEAPGTPTVKVGDQKFESGLWFREVTCKPVQVPIPDSEDFDNTIVTYTTDGSTPTASSPVYTAPIKCYQDMTVKFQAFYDWFDGVANEEAICDGADVDANVNFKFNAPTIEAEEGNVMIISEYEGMGATNFYAINGNEPVAGSSVVLTESATLSAYTEIANGAYGTFTSMPTTQDVYVLNALKNKETIEVTAGDVVLDEDATATSTTGEVYKVENGEIGHDNMKFFIKNAEFAAVAVPEYQAPEENERYIKMNNTRISFKVAANDLAKVKVTCSKNSCKTLNPDNDPDVTTDRKCYVNVSGTTYGTDDITTENGNIIEFELKGGADVTETDGEGVATTYFKGEDKIYTFQKYSGTGNILIAKIEFEVIEGGAAGISTVKADNANLNAPAYNLAGQKVNNSFKGLVIKGGKKFVK